MINVYLHCERGKTNHFVKGDCLGVTKDGGWTEYIEVPSRQVHVLPDDLSLDQATLCEPMSCVIRGWDNIGKICKGDEILIIGAGCIGLLWSCLFHLHGYKNVTITDISMQRMQVAENFKFGYKIHHHKDLKSMMSEDSSKICGFDLIGDCSGNVEVVNGALKWLRKCGKLNLFAIYTPSEILQLYPNDIKRMEITITGTMRNTLTLPRALEYVQAVAHEYLSLERLGVKICATEDKICAIEDYQHAIKMLGDGTVSKVTFKLTDDIK